MKNIFQDLMKRDMSYIKKKMDSLAYICNDGKIYGKGYKEECNLDNILRVLNNYLRGEDNVRKIVEYGE